MSVIVCMDLGGDIRAKFEKDNKVRRERRREKAITGRCWAGKVKKARRGPANLTDLGTLSSNKTQPNRIEKKKSNGEE